MNIDSLLVKDYLRLSQVFVYENDTLFNALEVMKRYNVDSISIIKEDFSLLGYLDKKSILNILETSYYSNISMLNNSKIKDVIPKYESPIVIYPRMTLVDAYSAMKCFNLIGLPVVDLPWEKKIIGFLWLEDILPIIEKNYFKVSV